MTSRLIVAPNWIGDSVMSLPVLRAIRRAHPGDRLAVVAPGGPAAVYQAEGSAGTILIRSGLLADAARLRREHFEEAWLLPNSWRSAVAPLLARIPARIGYATDGRKMLLTHSVAEMGRSRHQLRDYDALLISRGVEPDLEPPRLAVPAAASDRAGRALESAGLRGEAPVALLAPGSAGMPAKRWPAERYAELGNRLGAEGLACAAVVGPSEREIAAAVSGGTRPALPILGLDLDPVELAALLARARVVVANDSGPMHLAAAVGTPVVGLFGPTDPARTGPAGRKTRVVQRSSMREITVEEVVDAVLDVSS
jgi:heptosyltransferase-2